MFNVPTLQSVASASKFICESTLQIGAIRDAICCVSFHAIVMQFLRAVHVRLFHLLLKSFKNFFNQELLPYFL